MQNIDFSLLCSGLHYCESSQTSSVSMSSQYYRCAISVHIGIDPMTNKYKPSISDNNTDTF